MPLPDNVAPLVLDGHVFPDVPETAVVVKRRGTLAVPAPPLNDNTLLLNERYAAWGGLWHPRLLGSLASSFDVFGNLADGQPRRFQGRVLAMGCGVFTYTAAGAFVPSMAKYVTWGVHAYTLDPNGVILSTREMLDGWTLGLRALGTSQLQADALGHGAVEPTLYYTNEFPKASASFSLHDHEAAYMFFDHYDAASTIAATMQVVGVMKLAFWPIDEA